MARTGARTAKGSQARQTFRVRFPSHETIIKHQSDKGIEIEGGHYGIERKRRENIHEREARETENNEKDDKARRKGRGTRGASEQRAELFCYLLSVGRKSGDGGCASLCYVMLRSPACACSCSCTCPYARESRIALIPTRSTPQRQRPTKPRASRQAGARLSRLGLCHSFRDLGQEFLLWRFDSRALDRVCQFFDLGLRQARGDQ